jgi:creatinine amidohydrolase/Fe(II)-dependent formamide hydrolase-like protein
MKKKIVPAIFLAALYSVSLKSQVDVINKNLDVPQPQCWRWEQMKPSDLAEAIKTLPVAYLVISPLEWHGEAISFGCDPLIGRTVAEKAWGKTGGVIIPTLYIGVETLYHGWSESEFKLTDYWGMEWITKEHNPGSLYCSPTSLELLMREMLSFIEEEGFKICVIVSGHGGYEHVKVLRELEERSDGRPMKIIYSRLIEKEMPEELKFPGSGGHADFEEVSIVGSIDSTMVDKSKFGKTERDAKIGLQQKNVNLIDYNKGKKVLDFMVDQLVETVNEAIRIMQFNPERVQSR